MRVLIVDQDSASNEAIVRSLREHYTVDAVTNKGDCLDLLRSNTFEVVVATERLEDGSGLELLGQIGRKWPSVLRIFAADRPRLQLLKGRLGPFELFQTLAYPIDPERLIATLDLATAAQDAHADTSNIQHVVLTAEPPPDPEESGEDTEESAEEQQAAAFPAPRPAPRLAPKERQRARPAPVASNTRAAFTSRRGSSVGRNARAPQARAAQPAGTHSGASPRSVTGAGGGTARHSGRLPRTFRPAHGSDRPAPVRFPPLETTHASIPTDVPGGDPIAEAAALASTRSGLDLYEPDSSGRRFTVIAACAAAALLALVVLGVKLSGPKTESAQPAAPVAKSTPEYPPEVSQVLARIESALKTDDVSAARTEVDRLRQLAPSHPRLAFFDGLLARHAQSKTGSSPPGTGSKHARKSRKADPASETVVAESSSVLKGNMQGAGAESDHSQVPAGPIPDTAGSSPPAQTRSPMDPNGVAPSANTTRMQSVEVSTAASTPTESSASAASSASVAPAAATASSSPLASPAAAPGTSAYSVEHTALSSISESPSKSGSAATPRHASADDPPPVVREAKLIRRVDPEYPSAARHDAVAGSVDLAVVVSDGGIVRDVSVVRADPPGVFDKSAIAAVRKWKYDPRYVDGLPAEAHITVHLEFGPGR
jgi:TonB family protein